MRKSRYNIKIKASNAKNSIVVYCTYKKKSMKKSILLSALICVSICIGCSKDDEKKNTCDSCTGTNIAYEICDNGDGTYTLSKGEGPQTVTQIVTEEDLLGVSLTPKQFIEKLCAEN